MGRSPYGAADDRGGFGVSRVGLVGPVHPLRGGIALHTARFAQALRAGGHSVRVMSWSRQYPETLFPGTSQFDPGAPVCDLGEPPPEACLDSIDPRTWWQTADALRAWGADIVVLQRWHPFFAPALAAVASRLRRSGVRVCWMVHNARPHEGWPSLLSGFLSLGYDPRDIYLTHAESEAEGLRSLGVQGSIATIPHPAPGGAVACVGKEEARRALELGGGPVFLMFGYVRPYKGVDLFLEALEELAARESGEWSAVIAGEWYRPPTAGEKSALARLGSRVCLMDRFLPENEVEQLFAAASVVVLPYRHGTQSGVLLQAAAAGRPALVTDVGGLAASVAEGVSGCVVPPGDPKALAAALRSIWGGEAFDAQRIREHARRFSWQPLVAAVADAVHEEAA